MCSIFGLAGNSLKAKEAFDTLSHRGIDSNRFISSSNYFFGSHRLAIESFNKEQTQL